MGIKLSYKMCRENLPNLQSIINRTRNKKLKLKIDKLQETRYSHVKEERVAYVETIKEILKDMDSEDRDNFYRVFRDRKYMEGKTQIRVATSTRIQLKSLMERQSWSDYDAAVTELMAFFSANGG
ncbi:hypothetical protein [Rheinheimera metallidurans]|uniref:hypothetical protein n=1 Tax=Rheinheimera metallidurans TaxID=2925781 RepID=UPI0030034079